MPKDWTEMMLDEAVQGNLRKADDVVIEYDDENVLKSFSLALVQAASNEEKVMALVQCIYL